MNRGGGVAVEVSVVSNREEFVICGCSRAGEGRRGQTGKGGCRAGSGAVSVSSVSSVGSAAGSGPLVADLIAIVRDQGYIASI